MPFSPVPKAHVDTLNFTVQMQDFYFWDAFYFFPFLSSPSSLRQESKLKIYSKIQEQCNLVEKISKTTKHPEH